MDRPVSRIEMWLPTSVVKCTVIDGEVTIWDEMTMERRPLRQPAGFPSPDREPKPRLTPSREDTHPTKEKESSA